MVIIIITIIRTPHCLPIQARIVYKVSTLCHTFFSDKAPVYLSDLLLSTFHQDSSAPLLTEELYAFRT